MSDDLEALFGGVHSSGRRYLRPIPLDPEERLAMNRIPAPVPSPVEELPVEQPITITTLDGPPDLSFLTVGREGLATEPLRDPIVDGIKLGASWAKRSDVDVYWKRDVGSREVSYLYNRTPQERFLKDFTDSPERSNSYETVEGTGAIDLRKASLWLNYYGGDRSPGGISGTIRIVADGKIFEGEWKITSPRGNGGGDRGGDRAGSPYWTEIDLLALTGLQ
ncbi:MAG: hypothetical protein AAF191_08520 [Verrucomicrobiota bacterium]